MYLFSVSSFPGPECGVFCISIIERISRSALVLFSLFRAINYHCIKGPLKVDFFKCKTIHSRLLCIPFLHSISIRWVSNDVVIYIIMRYTWRDTFADIFHWPTTIILFSLYYILNYNGTLIFSQILNLLFCGNFEHNVFVAVKEIHNLWFLVKKNRCRNQIPVTQTKIPLKYGAL